MPKIRFEGREYDTPEQMTPEARARYEKAAKMLPDRDSNGIPDLLESDGSAAGPALPVLPVVSSALPTAALPVEGESIRGPGVNIPSTSARKPAVGSSKKGKLLIGVVIGLVVFCAACIFSFIVLIFASIRNSGAYQLAIETAKGNTTVQQVLGVPVEDGLFSAGSVEESDSSGSADLEIPLSGPSQSGTLYVKAVKEENTWRLLSLVLEAGGKQYQLFP